MPANQAFGLAPCEGWASTISAANDQKITSKTPNRPPNGGSHVATMWLPCGSYVAPMWGGDSVHLWDSSGRFDAAGWPEQNKHG